MDEFLLEPEELMRRAKDGDGVAFGRLYSEYYVPVFRYLYGRTRNRELASDLAQTVFLKVYEAIRRVEPNAAPLKFFFTVARNTLIDHWRRKKELTMGYDEGDVWQNIPDSGPNQIEIVEEIETSVLLRRALGGLKEEDQEILSLKYFSGLSAKEIGEELDLSDEAVRQRQCRALKNLREIMSRYGEQGI